MIRLKSLQQRFALFMLLPVAILLLSMGTIGFIYARTSLLAQWREAAVLKLQRAAHHVDMSLSRPKEWLYIYLNTAGKPYAGYIQESVIEQLKEMEGIARVNLTWIGEEPQSRIHPERSRALGQDFHQTRSGRRRRMRIFHEAKVVEFTLPRYDSIVEHETISLISNLNDESGRTIGRLEVAISFDYLIKDIVASGWWQAKKAFLLDESGKILTCTIPGGRHQFADNRDPVELATLAAMKEKPFGTVLGPGHPPTEVSGFYRLEEAPWMLVVIVPGKEILSPIIRFRSYYFITGAAFILFILLLIRWVTGRTVSSIKDVSHAAGRVARGDYGAPLPVKTEDEVGELIRSFNSMEFQLEERIRLKEALDLAMEVQQNLLPQEPLTFKGLDIVGKSIYCDETGGDYYDFIQFPELGDRGIGIAVGDVVGHGISAALLMTTVRALLRSRASQAGSLSQIITDVNRLLCIDTSQTGSFMTLFFAVINSVQREVRWVRAGHEPAILFDPAGNSFEELMGTGPALGIEGGLQYRENLKTGLSRGQILLIGTDGIWEARNPSGEMFGKERIKALIREQAQFSAQRILTSITDSLRTFTEKETQEDDVTLVVIKFFR